MQNIALETNKFLQDYLRSYVLSSKDNVQECTTKVHEIESDLYNLVLYIHGDVVSNTGGGLHVFHLVGANPT